MSAAPQVPDDRGETVGAGPHLRAASYEAHAVEAGAPPLEEVGPGVRQLGDAGRDPEGLVVARHGDEAALYAGVLRDAGSPLALKRLVTLVSRSSSGVPLALSGDELVYADADSEGRWRVRRALLDWP